VTTLNVVVFSLHDRSRILFAAYQANIQHFQGKKQIFAEEKKSAHVDKR
jgi:hypothetical protein